MLRMNTKKSRENIRNYIIENCCADNYIGHGIDTEPKTWEEVQYFVVSTFINEMLKHNNLYKSGRISKQKLFFEWCKGLPSALDTCYYYSRSAVDDLAHILEETDEEKSKFDESQAEEKLTRMIYTELFL